MSTIRKSRISLEQRNDAEMQIKEKQKQIDYDTKDFTVELLVDKFRKNEFFIPDYQRNYIWKEANKSSFIESVILGLPIPFMFFGDCDDGRMEVIDGAQRLQTLSAFVGDNLKLRKLKKLDKLNNFVYSNLLESQQRKLLNRSLRIVVLEEDTPSDVRQDLFNRINTSGVKANDSEIRRGSYPGSLTDFIEECCKEELFIKICPISSKNEQRHERFEFVLRFFAYVNNYKEFVLYVNTFLDSYLIDNMESFDRTQFYNEFIGMLKFVDKYFPNGFAKSATSKSTPRVRFESISVGVALALRERPELEVTNIDWIESDNFRQNTTTDASNNPGKLSRRIEYVKEQLLKE